MSQQLHQTKPKLLHYERRTEKLAPRSVFFKRLAFSLLLAFSMMACALIIGIVGYHILGGLHWIDSLLEASMILGGMGPINPLTTNAAKIFASLYALFSGLMFIGVMGVVLSPIMHRFLHKFHVDEEDIE